MEVEGGVLGTVPRRVRQAPGYQAVRPVSCFIKGNINTLISHKICWQGRKLCLTAKIANPSSDMSHMEQFIAYQNELLIHDDPCFQVVDCLPFIFQLLPSHLPPLLRPYSTM